MAEEAALVARAAAEHPLAGRAAHPLAEHPLAEHPLAAHPLAEHPLAEHPLAEHPLAEHPLVEHPPAAVQARPELRERPGVPLPVERRATRELLARMGLLARARPVLRAGQEPIRRGIPGHKQSSSRQLGSPPSGARSGWVLCIALLLVAIPRLAWAATRSRHFEPDDLELEQPGTLDVDLQVGPLLGNARSNARVVLPDFEVGLGLTRDVELDVSGAFTLDRSDGRRHITGDALWLAAKLGLLEAQDEQLNTWAFGLELGPRLPTVGATGMGYGVLTLLGLTHRALVLVLNSGCLIDPGTTVSGAHPTSLVLGVDLNLFLDARRGWSMQSELGVAHYLGSDPDEFAVTLGVTYAVSPKLDVSLTALSGLLANASHAGLLLGVSPELGLR